MSDEENTDILSNDSTPEVSQDEDVINKALDMGWKPRDQFTGNPLEWKEAGAFVKDEGLFTSLRAQQEKITNLSTALDEVKKFMAQSERKGYEKAIAELSQQQKLAAAAFDVESLNKINEDIVRVKSELAHTPIPTTQKTKTQDELDFERRHTSWYNTSTPENKEKVLLAQVISAEIAKEDSSLSAKEHIRKLEERLKKYLPKEFSNSHREDPGPVESSRGKGNSNDTATRGFSEQAIKTAKAFVKAGTYSKDSKGQPLSVAQQLEAALQDLKKYGLK